MRMSALVKWVLVGALVLAAAVLAYVRISDAIDDFEMQLPGPAEQSHPYQPPVYPHDGPLVRT
jgi:hypothetical protein